MTWLHVSFLLALLVAVVSLGWLGWMFDRD